MGSKKISQLTQITNPSLTGSTIYDDGVESKKVTLSTLRQTLVDSGSHVFTGNQVISGSLNVTGGSITGSLITANNVVLPQVSSSLNFVNDAAAATGGVPLGGLYRSGSFILIRLT